MPKEKVTVIMPVYNAQRYLRSCIDSILRQTLRDIFIIAIDDCSTDRSYDILVEYSKKDPRFLSMRNPYNLGAARTRNIGIQLARGKYLVVLDSDDYFEIDYIDELYKKCEKYNLDVAICNIYWRNDLTGKEYIYTLPQFIHSVVSKPFSPQQVRKTIFQDFVVVPFSKMVRRKFIEDYQIAFQDLKNCNDVYWGQSILVLSSRLIYIDRPLVHYRMNNPGSISSRRSKNPLCTYQALLKLRNLLIRYNLYQQYCSCYNTFAIKQIIYHLEIITSKDIMNSAIAFWSDKGIQKLDMVNKAKSDFSILAAYYQWKNFIGNINNIKNGTINNIKNEDIDIIYKIFFKELERNQYKVALWGYGKLGKKFFNMAQKYHFTILEIYDQNFKKHGVYDNVRICSFDNRIKEVDTIIVTNRRFLVEINQKVHEKKSKINVLDFTAFINEGATIEECCFINNI